MWVSQMLAKITERDRQAERESKVKTEHYN